MVDNQELFEKQRMVEVEKARSEENGGILEEFPQLIATAVLLKDILEGRSF